MIQSLNESFNDIVDETVNNINQIIKFDDFVNESFSVDKDCTMEYNVIDTLTVDFESKLEITEKRLHKYIIAIDNDECIGSWADMSLLYIILKMEYGEDNLNLDLFIDIMIKTNCIRPYVKELFEKILELKEKGIIYKIIMFTAASNSNNWVLFLSKILERWIGCKFYDDIIFQEMIEEWHVFNKTISKNTIGYIKNMDMIREIVDYKYNDDSRNFEIIALDDRPDNIINGISIGIKPYIVAVNIFEVLRLLLPDKSDYLISKYHKIINDSWEIYLRNPYKYTNAYYDREIYDKIECIEKLIYNVS